MNRSTSDLDLMPSFVVAIFRLNGLLVETGNKIVADIGLTTAWWQVLGALGYAPTSLSVAQIARNMGLTRQSVHRVIDILTDRGLVEARPNPDHRRARLMVLTAEGRTVLNAAEAAATQFNSGIVEKVGRERLANALQVVAESSALLSKDDS